MIFWHVGGALFIARWVFRDPKMDLRVLALGAVLPDLLDKPIGSLVFHGYFRTGRIYGHTLLFAALLLAGVMALTRRGTTARRRWMALPIGVFIHLLLDIPLESATFWWPFLGFEFPPFEDGALGDLIRYLSRSPWVLAQEAIGLTYLVGLYRKSGLGDAARRSELVSTGTLSL
jgi:hypothetical protein